MNHAVQRLRVLLANNRVRQAGVLYISLITSLVLGIGISIINTRLLGPQAFGEFKLLQTIWMLGVVVVTFGLFTTGGNLLARRDSLESERRLMGSLLAVACAISLLFVVLVAVASFPIGHIYGHDLGGKMRLYSALVFVFPLQVYLQESLRGINNISSLALLNALPQLLYIPAALGVSRWIGFSLDAAILIYLLGILATVLTIIIRSKPRFEHIQQGVDDVLKNNRAIGFNIYLAVLMTSTTAQLGHFTLAYFYDVRLVGMFALAITITMPLTMIPNAISTTLFKRFVSLDKMPNIVIFGAIVISVVVLLVFLSLIREIILFFYTSEFIEVIPLAYICAVGAVLHGMGDIYNRFLLAHANTKALRTNAIIMAITNVFGYVFFVVWWGVLGAAFTKILVDAVYVISMLFYYRQNQKIKRVSK